MPVIHLIGLGMSPADLTPRHREIIDQAQVLVGGRRLLDYFPAHPAVKIILGKNPEAAMVQAKDLAASRRVVILASGDPNFFGIGPLAVQVFGCDQVVIWPNITTVQAAAARLKIAWQDAAVVSLHGRSWEGLSAVLGQAEKIMVFTDPGHTPGAVADFLLERGFAAAKLCVLEDLGQVTERLTWLTPAEAREREFSALNLVAVFPGGAGAGVATSRLHLGLPEEALEHERGLITKTEVRAVALAKLALRPGQVIWDIGAGCGSVGIEASLLIPGGQVFAIEQNPARTEQIRRNRGKFGVTNLQVVCGQAPDCLAGLPDPQRVFIGGGGTQLRTILTAVLARLKANDRLVISATLLETVAMAQQVLTSHKFQIDLVHLQVSRAAPLGPGHYLKALNPVWLITAWPPE